MTLGVVETSPSFYDTVQIPPRLLAPAASSLPTSPGLDLPVYLQFRLSTPAQGGFVSTEDPANTLSNSPMGRSIVIFFPPRALAERRFFSAFGWVFLSLLITRKVTLQESGEDKTESV